MLVVPLLVACTADEPFRGIETLAWDGADGLIASWAPAGAPAYRVSWVDDLGQRGEREVESTAAELRGLRDGGVYEVRVEALFRKQAAGRRRVLRQLVGPNRLRYVAHDERQRLADVHGEGDLLVAAARDGAEAFVVYDVSDPEAPEVLHVQRDAGLVKDVKLAGGLLYTSSESGDAGVHVWDLADPSAPELLSTIGAPASSVHNLSVGDGFLYVTDNRHRSVRAYDVADPTAPVEVWSWAPELGYVHDQVWVDGLLYVAWWRGLSIFDVTDPYAPVEVQHHEPGGAIANVHQVVPTEDGTHVLVTSEAPNGALTVVDLTDPEGPRIVAELRSETPGVSVHNVVVRGDLAFVAWYHDGVVVLDISDPADPVEVGRYDTLDHAGTAPDYDPTKLVTGAWGVWPLGDHVAVSDTVRGLFVLELFGEVTSARPR